ncbi:hypothetical protein R6Q59_000058, partial [Mikania micrantha]
SGSKKWMVLNTRSSPAQRFRCMKLFRDNQRESVRKMGLAKLQKFNLDDIPSRGVRLKTTPKLIHKIWGIPNGGIQEKSIVPLDMYDATISKWSEQYESRLLETRKLVKRIESTEDEDTFEFEMNFIMLFMT